MNLLIPIDQMMYFENDGIGSTRLTSHLQNVAMFLNVVSYEVINQIVFCQPRHAIILRISAAAHDLQLLLISARFNELHPEKSATAADAADIKKLFMSVVQQFRHV